jgi:hypothetical protein
MRRELLRSELRSAAARCRGSRRVIPVAQLAQLADGISQFGMSPRIWWVMEP